ncbi:sodium:calcium antiporter [Patescibacteria group bacterium]|nr:sodium:calcium antiporter [Patescibacteria group bacterium]
MIWLFIFIISCFVLFWSGSRLVKGLIRMARYLGWREFVVAFFVMAFAGTLPNLFVGINSALHGIPQLSFGEVVGGNVADLTLAVALAILIGGTALQVRSKMVQTSTIFTVAVAILPLILILDGNLGRGDGLILLLAFGLYILWLFSKEERFRKVYKGDKYKENKNKENKNEQGHNLRFIDFLRNRKEPKSIRRFKTFLKDLRKITVALILLLAASWGVVQSAQVFADALNVTLPIIGILIVGLGNALPETYFAIVSARKRHTWLILGNLMGSVIVCATLVLGIVVLIHPIKDIDFSPFAIARIFLIISAVFFLIVVRTDQKITKIEAFLLLGIYILFLVAEIFFR